MASNVARYLRKRGRFALIALAGKCLSSWAIPQANQDQAYDHGSTPEANAKSLEGSKAAPLTSTEDIDRDDTNQTNGTEGDDEDSELAFGDHMGMSHGNGSDYSIAKARCNFRPTSTYCWLGMAYKRRWEKRDE
jgi:hypothetical protein